MAAQKGEDGAIFGRSKMIYSADGLMIHLTDNPPQRFDELVLASVDGRFRGGQLGEVVSRKVGIPLPETPPESGDFVLLPHASSGQTLGLVRSVGTPLSPVDNLKTHLGLLLQSYSIIGQRVWVPFMGTGAAGLTYTESGTILLDTLLAPISSARAEGLMQPTEIHLAVPEETSDKEFNVLHAFLRGYVEVQEPLDDPILQETRKLLDRVFYAQLERGKGTITFEFNEVLAPTNEFSVWITEEYLAAHQEAASFLEGRSSRRIIKSTGEDSSEIVVNTPDPKQIVWDFRDLKAGGPNPHLTVTGREINDNPAEQVFAGTKGEKAFFVPVSGGFETPPFKSLIHFIQAVASGNLFKRATWNSTFRFAFNAPLSDSGHATLLQAVKRTIEELGGTFPGPAKAPSSPNEMPAQFHSDHALTDATQDQLGRDAIAGAIATNVTRVWDDQMKARRPFAVHLSGRWGSGKSSILAFLKARLEADTSFSKSSPGTIYPVKKQGWVVVNYNAWQMQEAGPPWWSLLIAVRQQGYAALGGQGYWPRAMDWLWQKTRVAWPWLVTLAVIIALIAMYSVFGPDNISWTEAISEAETPWAFVVAIITALGSIATLAKLVQSWSKTATETAEAVRDLQSDPTAVVKERFKKIIGTIDRPVAVFIDDLDRCDAQFVVDLLQALQTAYANVPVLYVVAADRNWIVSAYNQVYKDFKSEISRPGVPLGYLFVKKIFQLSVPVPDLVPTDRARLAEVLLATETPPLRPTKTKQERARQIDVAAAKGDIEEVTRIVGEARSEGQNMTSEAIEAVASEANQQKLRHALFRYVDLFDANPRAIKRLVNALTFRQGYIAGTGQPIEFDVIARWTILTLRFPYSADLLSEAPTRLAQVFAGPPPKDAVEFPNRAAAAQILDGLTQDDVEKVAAFG